MRNDSYTNGFSNSVSLFTQINDIKNSRSSKEDKVKALISLGLMKKEAEDICKTHINIPVSSHHRFTFTFGVEIECIVNKYDVQNTLGRDLIHIEGYNHTDHHDGIYKFVTDVSVVDDHRHNYHEGSNAIECVSPVLKSVGGMKSLEKVVKAINDNGGYANKSCGLHVHIGAAGLTGEQYVNVFKNYQKLEGVIDSFMAPSRRGNCRWACSLQGFNFSYCHNQRDVESVIGTRYCKVNPESYTRHNTIEFRQHQGTTNFKKMQMWVRFLGKLINYSKSNVLASEVTSIDAIPFLSKTEKDFYKARKNALNGVSEAA